MQIIDPKFKNNKKQYILQSLFVVLIVFIIMCMADSISEMTIVASLGSSVLAAFIFPNKRSSQPRYMIGGYAIGIIIGIILHYCNTYLKTIEFTAFGKSPHVVTCAIAVGIVMFIMTLTNCEHPPAAGLTMGLVLEKNAWMISMIAFISIVIVSIIKAILKKWLIDLM